MSGEDQPLHFAEDRWERRPEAPVLTLAEPAWIVVIVDDDQDIHSLTRLLLHRLVFDGIGVRFLHGYSVADANRLVRENPDAAVLLLDVVMEKEDSGLEVVRHIRQELNNRFLRIILRTGQAGQVLESEAIAHYDINDYKEKSELTAQKLVSAVTLALRNYRDLRIIENLAASNDLLEERIQLRTWELTETNKTLRETVADSRRKEEALRKSQERLAMAQQIAQLGNWEWDLATGEISWSEEIERLLGIPPVPSGSPCDTFEKAVHPEDHPRVREVIPPALARRQPYELVHRIVRPDGEERTVHAICRVIREASGLPVRLMGTLHDITERRRAEEQLRDTTEAFNAVMAGVEEQLRITTKIFENSVEGIIICDADNVIQYVNPAFTAITGFTPTQAIGSTPRQVLRSNRHEAGFYEAIKAELALNGRWQGEMWNRRSNGEAFPEHLTITAMTNQAGEVTNYISIFHDLSNLKRSEEALHYNTNYDALTGLSNRTLFLDRVKQALIRANESQGTIGIVMFGLDQFKKINESLGYAVGDLLLQETANRLKRSISGDDTLCRLGGDEFAVILTANPEIRQAVRSVRTMAQAIAQPFHIQGSELHLTASFGIAFFPDDGLDSSALLKSADTAMNRVKNAGRNNYQFYTAAMDAATARRLQLENSLRRGLEQNEFFLHYQPKMETATGAITGMEALVRWKNPELGIVQPGDFIPLTEETGVIVPLGEWILESACRQTVLWRAAGFPDLRVAVNLSARQFQQERLTRMVAETLATTGLPPHGLELEITESMVMGDVERAIAIMEELREMGVFISMDDFGTGYSSLSYLKSFPIHALKIDRSFLQDLSPASNGAAIASAIIAMAHRLHLKVVAEGVETEEHLTFLREYAADEWQGYLCSRPLSVADFTQFLEQHRPVTASELLDIIP